MRHERADRIEILYRSDIVTHYHIAAIEIC